MSDPERARIFGELILSSGVLLLLAIGLPVISIGVLALINHRRDRKRVVTYRERSGA